MRDGVAADKTNVARLLQRVCAVDHCLRKVDAVELPAGNILGDGNERVAVAAAEIDQMARRLVAQRPLYRGYFQFALL